MKAVHFLQTCAIQGPDVSCICLSWWLSRVFSGIFLVKYTNNHSKLVLQQIRKRDTQTLAGAGAIISVCVSPSYNLQSFPKTRRRHHLHLCAAQDELYVCVTLHLSKNEHSLLREKANWVYVLERSEGEWWSWVTRRLLKQWFWSGDSSDTTPGMSWPALCHTVPMWLLPACSLANFLESIGALK